MKIWNYRKKNGCACTQPYHFSFNVSKKGFDVVSQQKVNNARDSYTYCNYNKINPDFQYLL